MSKDRDDKKPVGPFEVERLGGDAVVGSEGGGGWRGGGTGEAPDSDTSVIEDTPLDDAEDEAEREIRPRT